MLGEKKVIFCGVYDVQAALGGRSNVPGKLFSKTIKNRNYSVYNVHAENYLINLYLIEHTTLKNKKGLRFL